MYKAGKTEFECMVTFVLGKCHTLNVMEVSVMGRGHQMNGFEDGKG